MNRWISPCSSAFALALVVSLPSLDAGAVDGVAEINQTCAVTTGCVPGDSAGFPVELRSPGSYRLTSDLQLPDEKTDGVLILGAHTTLDLNGFAIRGVSSCQGSGATIECGPRGPGDGVDVAADYVRVQNGHIVGVGRAGVVTGAFTGFEGIDLVATENEDGFSGAGTNSSYVRCRGHRNASRGFFIGRGESVLDSQASGNGDVGIVAFSATVQRATATGNGLDGIKVFEDGSVLDSVALNNGATGLELGRVGQARNVANGNATGTILGGISIGPSVCDGVSC